MKIVASGCLFLLLCSAPAHAQTPESSRWGAIGTFVPWWRVPPSMEVIASLHFSEDDAEISAQELEGQELRIGIARGRMHSGDWGVSYVRKTYADKDIPGEHFPGCQGGSSRPGQPTTFQCEEVWTDISRNDVVLNGIEVHKFIAFGTFGERVQVGLNIAGGFGTMSGTINTASFSSTYSCSYPPGVRPPFFDPNFEFPDDFSPCDGAPSITTPVTVQTGSTTEDVSRMLKSETSKMMPIGRVELAGAFLIGPDFKVRVAGGLNYPGTNAISITGLYFFGD